MSLVGFHARNHRQQVGKRGPRPDVDDRATTPEVFGPLHERFGFTIDVAASPANAKLPRFYTLEDDGLAQEWTGERVWCNPPYSSIEPWVEKAHGGGAELVVFLLPANRTEQGWWQRQVEPYRLDGTLTVEFLPGRLRFLKPGQTEIKPNERPPFGCCLVIFDQAAALQQGEESLVAGHFDRRCYGRGQRGWWTCSAGKLTWVKCPGCASCEPSGKALVAAEQGRSQG